MKNSGSRYIRQSVLFLTILFSGNPVFLAAQSLDETYAFALFESRQGNYDIAIKSLKRLQFFDDQNAFPQVFRLLADCYFQKADYENAYYYYDLAFIQAENDSLQPQIAARKISCKLFEQQYQEALIDLLSFNQSLTPLQQSQFDALFAITYYYLFDYEQSKQYFLKCAELIQPAAGEELNAAFQKVHRIEKRFNPRTAKVLSIIVPGLGQVWAGDYRDGINSFLLVSGLLSASVAMAATISTLDAVIIVAPWFQRYYMGGYQKSYEIAVKRQDKEKLKILAQIVKMINPPALP